MILVQEISMEAERIEAVKNCLEPNSLKNIRIFLGFANFYQYFIQGFDKISMPLTLMLKTTFTTSTRILLKAVDKNIF